MTTTDPRRQAFTPLPGRPSGRWPGQPRATPPSRLGPAERRVLATVVAWVTLLATAAFAALVTVGAGHVNRVVGLVGAVTVGAAVFLLRSRRPTRAHRRPARWARSAVPVGWAVLTLALVAVAPLSVAFVVGVLGGAWVVGGWMTH